jgi:hypothetical protein
MAFLSGAFKLGAPDRHFSLTIVAIVRERGVVR